MATYRDTEGAAVDAEVAAFADLSRRVRSTRLRVLLPLLLLTIAVAGAAALLHASGAFPVGPRFEDGSYLVTRGSILIVAVIAGALVAGPGMLLYRFALSRALKEWRRFAAERQRLDDATIDGLARMYAPRQPTLEADPPAPHRVRRRRRSR